MKTNRIDIIEVKLYDMFYVAAAVHKNIPEATLQQINEALGNWFRNWRDRQGGRNKRRIDGGL